MTITALRGDGRVLCVECAESYYSVSCGGCGRRPVAGVVSIGKVHRHCSEDGVFITCDGVLERVLVDSPTAVLCTLCRQEIRES